MIDDTQITATAARGTTGGSDEGDWVALVPVWLNSTEKQLLEKALARGSVTAEDYTAEYEVLDSLDERGFLWSRRSLETEDVVYTLTDLGTAWVKGCRQEAE